MDDKETTIATARSEYDENLQKAVDIPVANSTEQGEVQSISSTNISSGGLVSLVRIGAKGQIIVNDGTDDRVLIGYQASGF